MAVFLYILLPILASVLGEFLLKVSVGNQPLRLSFESLMMVITTPYIVLGVFFIGCSALLWIVGLSRFQLSFMYPFLSLNYVIVIVGSEYLLKEDVSINRYISILFMIIGLVIISKSQHTKLEENNVNHHK